MSVIIPTFCRERILIDTIHSLLLQLKKGDELLIVDQTPNHEAETQQELERLSANGVIRWIRKSVPNQSEALNVGALLARGSLVLFLDDDIIPSATLIEGHRMAFAAGANPPATLGQVLQPWNKAPISDVPSFDVGFNAAYDKACDVRSLMSGNFAMHRSVFVDVGGMDENFRGSNYRNDTEMGYRIAKRTGKLIRFVPEASIRHLLAGGGNRAFGGKDSWGGIGGSTGDYYFAFRCLTLWGAITHSVQRVFRAPVSRYTLYRPWLIPMIVLREFVAIGISLGRIIRRPNNYIKQLSDYTDVQDAGHTTHG